MSFLGGGRQSLRIVGGGYQDTCVKTHIRIMGQPSGPLEVHGGNNGGTVGEAVIEFHGRSPDSSTPIFYCSGWNDAIDHVKFIIGENSEPGSIKFCAVESTSGSIVKSAEFEVHVNKDNLNIMNSSGLDGTGVTGTVKAVICGNASTGQYFSTSFLTEIDELVVESGSFTMPVSMDLDRLEVKESGTVALRVSGKAATLGELAGSGTVLFEKQYAGDTAYLPITVNSISVPKGARIKVGRDVTLSSEWVDGLSIFQGPGVAALDSADCFTSAEQGFYLEKDGNAIKVRAGTERKQASIDPTPTFDKSSYQYGETMHITMGLQSEGNPLPGQTLEVRGGVSGLQTFAVGETGADGQVSFDLPVDDKLWDSREEGLEAIFHGTENYIENFYGISLKDGAGSIRYIVTGARVILEGIPAPVRGAAPVKPLSTGGSAVCSGGHLVSGGRCVPSGGGVYGVDPAGPQGGLPSGRQHGGGGDSGGGRHGWYSGSGGFAGRCGDSAEEVCPRGGRRGGDGGGRRGFEAGGSGRAVLQRSGRELGGGRRGLRQRAADFQRHRPRRFQPQPAHDPRHAGGGAPQPGEQSQGRGSRGLCRYTCGRMVCRRGGLGGGDGDCQRPCSGGSVLGDGRGGAQGLWRRAAESRRGRYPGPGGADGDEFYVQIRIEKRNRALRVRKTFAR